MTGIEKKKDWLPKKPQAINPKMKPKSNWYTVSEVALLLGVDRSTVWKWLSDDDGPESSIIPASAWNKFPNGTIRIKEWIVLKLLNETK